MTHQRHRLNFPYTHSRIIATGVRNHGLRSFTMLGLVLTLLIFTVQGGQTNAALPGKHAKRVILQPYQAIRGSIWDNLLALQRQHFLARLHFLATEKTLTVNNNSSMGVRLSTIVSYTAVGPDQVSMINVDLTTHIFRLGVIQAYNRLISPAETLSSMANRTGALAGINGDFFEIHGTDVPIGEEVINGQLLHSPNPQFYAVLGVTSSGRLTIGPEYFSGDVTDGTASYPLYSINHYSEINNGRLVLFTPALGEPVYVGGDPVAIIQPVAGSSTAFKVVSIYSGALWLPALSGQNALVGSGYSGSWLATTLHRGDHIQVTDHITPDAQLFQAIGGGPQVLKNGAPYYDPNQPVPGDEYNRNPQTAVGVSRDGTHALFAVFDGRLADQVKSRGMSPAEVGRFMLAHGAYNAIMFDSGGSSEMVARLPGHRGVSIINWPSGGYERPVANGLFIYTNDLAQ